MHDDDPGTVKRMLLYLYTLDYPEADEQGVPAEHVAIDRSFSPHVPHENSTANGEETQSGMASGSCESAYSRDPRMMNNVFVYAIAEKYDIPELKDLAKRKFETLVRSKWPHDDFYNITKAVFSTTPDGDMGLRQNVMDVCGNHFQDILRDEQSGAAFLDNKVIAAAVLDAAVRKSVRDEVLLDKAAAKRIALQDELSKAISTIKELEAKLAKARLDTSKAVDQKNHLSSRLSDLVQNSNNWQKCKNCKEEFAPWFERSGSGIHEYDLLCGSCGCRHTV